MSESKIQAEPRTEFGKGAARRIRRADKVPAVLYGHGTPPVHITLPGHETMLALKHGGVNALLTIVVEGKSQLALPKQVQRDPIKGFLEHLDLIVVKRGEKVTVEVPVHVVGDPAPETMVITEHGTVSVEAEATHIPEFVEVSLEGAEAGTQVLAKDLTLPSGSTVHLDGETLIVHVTHAPAAEQLEEELAEAEAEVGIEHEESEAEAAEETSAPESAEGGESSEESSGE
jgi:large subunit ribosomal protein L25